MKKLYFLLFLTFSFLANAQIVNIPDANFKAALLSASPSNSIASFATPDSNGNVSTYNYIDTNGDGEIQVSEAQAIKVLRVFSLNISDVAGIQYFTNLISFNASNNQLTSIDLSYNNSLIFLNLSLNSLVNLDINQNINLKSISASYNLLTDINLGSNNSLLYLDINNNQLTSIDLTQLPSLQEIYITQNLLTGLNIAQNLNLKIIYLSNNQISSINLSQNTLLEKLYLYNNQITSIDVTQLPLLTDLDVGTNLLTSLNTTQNSNLKILWVSSNQILSIDLSQNALLEELGCNNTQLSSIDVTNITNLIKLYCPNIPNLQTLYLKNGNASPWTTLNFSGNPNLEFVCCDDDDLTLVQQKIIDYGYTTCQASNLSCDYPTLYEVSGNVQYDYFENGCNGDIDDLMVPNVKYEIFDGTSTVITSGNQIGNYYIPLGTGNYTITPVIENPNYFTISPTNFTVNFPTDASPFEQNVCLTWNGLEYYDDLEVTILPTTPARPGFEAKYKVIVRNKGFDETNGTVTLSYDNSILTYVSSAPVFNSSNTNTISWDFYSLPFLTLEFDVVFNLNSPSDSPAVNIDDELHFTANVIHDWTDYTPADNTFTLDQIVVGSYDPNDKTCLQGETEEVSIVGEYVHYMIRFENTGTFAAQTVRIEDIIDTSKFDISTLIPLQASHSFYTKINGNLVEFVFDNINLDYNAPNNGGYIAFKIKLLPTLTIGDTFSNSSNIYFDANPAIITNTYTTTIVAALANQSFSENEFTIYPNPASSILNIQSKNDLEIQSVEIYNILGQIVLAVSNNTNAIDVSSLISGTYFIKVNTENGSINTRFVKE